MTSPYCCDALVRCPRAPAPRVRHTPTRRGESPLPMITLTRVASVLFARFTSFFTPTQPQVQLQAHRYNHSVTRTACSSRPAATNAGDPRIVTRGSSRSGLGLSREPDGRGHQAGVALRFTSERVRGKHARTRCSHNNTRSHVAGMRCECTHERAQPSALSHSRAREARAGIRRGAALPRRVGIWVVEAIVGVRLVELRVLFAHLALDDFEQDARAAGRVERKGKGTEGQRAEEDCEW